MHGLHFSLYSANNQYHPPHVQPVKTSRFPSRTTPISNQIKDFLINLSPSRQRQTFFLFLFFVSAKLPLREAYFSVCLWGVQLIKPRHFVVK